MKSPLAYLTLTKLKNQLISVIKTPVKLIYALVIIALLVFSILGGDADLSAVGARPAYELTAIVTLFYTVMLVLVFANGSFGVSMFSMPDTALLFPSPLSPNRILFYGLLRQMGISLLFGLFLPFQYSWMNQLYGVDGIDLMLIMLGYAVTLLFAQLSAMAIYTRTSGKENGKRNVKLGIYAAVLIYAVAAIFYCREEVAALFSGGKNYSELLSAAADFFSGYGLLFPFSGWAAGMVNGLMYGDITRITAAAVALSAAAAALVTLIVKSKANYYEEALKGAEVAQSTTTAKKEGKFNEIQRTNIKVGKTGLNRGRGASAIYFKHRLESRRGGILAVSPMQLVFIAIVIIYTFIIRMEFNEMAIISAFAMSVYFGFFSSITGQFAKETAKPYIYLIPEPPMKKLLYALLQGFTNDCIEAVLTFVPIALILKASPLDIAMCILAKISFSMLFTAGNILVQRVFGTLSFKVLTLLFYVFVMIGMFLPGVAAAVALSVLEILPMTFGILLGLTVANIPVALGVIYLCRNVLQYSELNNK